MIFAMLFTMRHYIHSCMHGEQSLKHLLSDENGFFIFTQQKTSNWCESG